MQGYGTAQELMTFRSNARHFKPDIVIIQFFAANDVRNNSRTLENDPARPYFVLQGNVLKLDSAYRDFNGAWFRR